MRTKMFVIVMGILLVACSEATGPSPTMLFELTTAPEPTATTEAMQAITTEHLITATSIQATTVPTTGEVTQEPNLFPLPERGPYNTGTHRIELEDPSRADRKLSVDVWYPAVVPEGSEASARLTDADPDLSGAPYPLLLMFSDTATLFASNLVSHGFVIASVVAFESYEGWDRWLIDFPLDIVFALDQLASNPPNGLEGIIDTDHAGAMGYSYDGYVSLALSGARADPDRYLTQCAQPPEEEPARPEWLIPYMCDMTAQWDEIVTYAGEAITASEDGMWQPMTDERIRAVMPMAPEGAWWFGERGLAAVDRPTMIIVGTADNANPYELEAVPIFEHMGTPDRVMVSFVGQRHESMILKPELVSRMQHFAVAFFGYHLQGREDYAAYFSEDFVSQYDDLYWGVYPGQ